MSAPEAWHVTRTLRAMELLAVRPRSAPELAEALGVHVRTARRVLKRLDSEGYVALTDERRRRYRPTMRVVALAGQVVERAELPVTALPHVRRLRELVPCHCTAAGKALLAWRDGWRDAVLEQPLASFTERTNVGPESLRRELARTVARGYSVEDREYDTATRALAAPVFAEGGEAVAALAVVGPVEQLQADRYSELGAAVMSAAEALSADLGHAPAVAA